MRILKDLRFILLIILLVSWGIAILFFMKFKGTKELELSNKDTEIADLQNSLDLIGELVPAYTVRADVLANTEIKEEDLDIIEVPLGAAYNLIQDSSEVLGMYYKVGLTAGTPLTKDLVYEIPITDDLRLYDVVTHTNPVGLEAGAYVDIRISMPMGEDYIAIPHKQVKEINSGVLKLALTENDIHIYSSMLIDSIIYPGTQIYAVEYLEGGVQKPAEAYYPASKTIIAIAGKDPNLLNAIRTDMLNRRDILEEGITLTEEDLKDMNRKISEGRKNVLNQISTSQAQVDKEREEFERRQAEEAANQ